MKILLLGPNGQVGWELRRSLAPVGRLAALGREQESGLCGDLGRFDALAETVGRINPDVIVNAAAYTAVDRAGSETETAWKINAGAPEVLARQAGKIDALLIHYSTDYVFDGKGSLPWREEDTCSPVNFYGRTKLEGEEAIRKSGCSHLIFRTSWVYAARGRNFLGTILELAKKRESLRVVSDQFGAPTGAELIADVTAHVLRSAQKDSGLCGTYHLAAAGETTWHGYAGLAIDTAKKAGMRLKASSSDITAVTSEEFPTAAPRPRNSSLDCKKLEHTFGLQLPDWKDGVKRAVSEISLIEGSRERR